jgi:predicted metal-dependent phosphoesterase TrpH
VSYVGCSFVSEHNSAPHFDLQAHSTCSDGVLSPSEVVARASQAGVKLLALTDHDTVDGVAEALAAADANGISVVPAIEISAVDDGSQTPRELHILGYRIDHTDPAFRGKLAAFLADRERRTLRMADGLSEAGFELDRGAIDTRLKDGKPIGRPHLAEAVLAHPANAQRLREESIDEVGALIRGYLIEGKSAYRLRETPTIAQAIEAIHGAGGVAIWAHPFWDVSDPDEVLGMIDRFRALGIDGVEAFYISHTREQTVLLVERCSELEMLSTGSADFHGPENRLFSRFRAFETYDYEANLGPIAED